MQGRVCVGRTALAVCIALLVVVSSCASAGTWTDYILSTHTSYWVVNTQSGLYRTTDDPNSIAANDVPLIEVQLKVYDKAYTDVIKTMFPQMEGVTGHLYAYSVTNRNFIQQNGSIYTGLTDFRVVWSTAAVGQLNHQTWPDWNPYSFSNGSNSWVYGWSWNRSNDNLGLLPGQTIGGFWLFANTPECEWISAGVNSNPIAGFTYGPTVPEPGGFMALLSGMVGLLGFAARRRRA